MQRHEARDEQLQASGFDADSRSWSRQVVGGFLKRSALAAVAVSGRVLADWNMTGIFARRR
jgi:hypothetical protein